MTPAEKKMLDELSRCTFQIGSFDKRFVRNLAGLPLEFTLTDKQARLIPVLHHRYRRQIKNHQCSELCQPPEREVRVETEGVIVKVKERDSRKALRELEKLHKWIENSRRQ